MPLTFPWSKIPIPQDISGSDYVDVIRHRFTGYDPTRPRHPRTQKTFTPLWNFLTQTQFVEFVKFWQSVFGGSDVFYFQYPLDITDTDWGGSTVGSPPPGWDSNEQLGNGNIFIVKFVQESLSHRKSATMYDRWEIQVSVREQ